MRLSLNIPVDVHKKLMIEMLWNQENTRSQANHEREQFVVLEESMLKLPFVRLRLALVVSGESRQERRTI